MEPLNVDILEDENVVASQDHLNLIPYSLLNEAMR